MEVTVAIATDEERQVLWERLVARAPFFAKYQAKMTAARIRVVPCEGSSAGQVAGAESTSDSWLWGALSTPVNAVAALPGGRQNVGRWA